MQISSVPSSKKISELIGLMEREELVLQPIFQRKLVWNAKHKEAFIDTILHGYPFPEIYIAQSKVDLETLMTQQIVVDGQQRLSTIKDYIDNYKPSFCQSIPRYADLKDDEKRNFLNYDVVVRDLKDASMDVIREIFRRINQTKYNLTQIEIQNAIYDGEFISTAKEILDSFDNEKIPLFSETEISRMGDLGFIVLLMSTFENGGYFSGNSITEKLIIDNNDFYPNKIHIKCIFNEINNKITNLNLSGDSIWFRKSNFFTMFFELATAKNLPNDLGVRLSNFEKNIINSKENKQSDFGEYYSNMYTGTNSRSARLKRGELFKKYVLCL